ncbi:MAG: adenine phosphoribosyltransferase [Defluviicoccus sp.]|nr:adenine phosphoribosyltransferase [Defluviicoccus sp.]MDE0382611.1 adenine phosphoribosyltransferase [Defluviicoccus sp.]
MNRTVGVAELKHHIRQIPDFPKPGILFYDISTLLQHADAWATTVDALAEAVSRHEPDRLIGIESRGFLVAAPLALRLGLGFTMVRKKDKLPGATIAHEYALEYGADTVEIQADAIAPGQRVVVLDDLLATGGTMSAAIELLREVGADVRGAACIIELSFLRGRARLDVPIDTLVAYDS